MILDRNVEQEKTTLDFLLLVLSPLVFKFDFLSTLVEGGHLLFFFFFFQKNLF